MDLFPHSGSEKKAMQNQTGHVSPEDGAATGTDARVSLLAEVGFKWLMAGQGWWVDTARFHCEPVYAAGLLRLALTSQSVDLRECAALLQAHLAGQPARGAASGT